MNWYKIASEDHAVSVTAEQFGAMTWEEKRDLIWPQDPNISARALFSSQSSTLTQRLFFTEQYLNKGYALTFLAVNRGITQAIQRLFFTEEYELKSWALSNLSLNRGITQETQLLFLTEEYSDKDDVLQDLVKNPSFLRGFTSEQWLRFKNAAKGSMRLLVLKKRLEQIVGTP